MSEVCSIEMLHRLLALDPETGILTWKARTVDMFSECKNPEARCRSWNSRFAGTRALNSLDTGGYRFGAIFGRQVTAHRVVYALAHGHWPKDQIDHLDGVRTNNRPGNLRTVTHSENNRNAWIRSDNTSGHCGVYWHKNSRKWHAQIRIDGKPKHLGYFDHLEQAVAARKAAEQEQGGYTDRHGSRRDGA